MKQRDRAVQTILALGAIALSGSAFAGKPLFTGQVAPQRVAALVTGNVAAQASTQSMRVVRADASVVSAATQEITFDLGLRQVDAVLENSSVTSSGSTVWSGRIKTAKARNMSLREVRDDAANDVTLVRRGDGVTGNLRVDGTLYRVRPLADGNHAVIEVDESKMPADHPAEYADVLRRAAATSPSSTTSVGTLATDPGVTATIRVQVVATNQAVTAYGGDMRALVDLAVAEANQGYVNSNVGINLQLANYRTVSYTSVSHGTDLARFRSTSDGIMDDIHTTRDQNAADVSVLITSDSSYCGLASAIGASASTAFATVYYDCATGYYSFAHEIGHLQSARHDPSADPTTTPYAYGHGYRAPNNAWRTVMAYNCTVNCPRLNYWSNPDVTYGGQAMGTATQSHNQRVLVNTKATIAAFRGTTPPPTGAQTYTNGVDYAIRDNATVESPVTVSGRIGLAPTNASVSVNIVHTYRGDMLVQLVAPDGSLYTLSNRAGGSADNLVGTYALNLSTEVLNGTWKLRVNDNAAGDTGRIDTWSITF